ncbi:MAG: hypothetical protein DWQ05_16295 [Calditrichaeota bacterium]|nr:MAG: hypothetical protein DWQ05_16295 [Calditrichota bacterium]
MKLLIYFLFYIIVLPPCFAQIENINFSISPPIIDLKVHSNSSRTIFITMNNSGTEPLEISTKLAELGMTIKGQAFPQEPIHNQWSCTDWIILPFQKYSLKPNENKKAKIVIRIPGGADGGKYGIILFEAFNKQKNDLNGLNLVGRLGTLVLLELRGPKKIEGIIGDFYSEKVDAHISFKVIIKNSGNIHFKGKGSIVIFNAKNRIIDRVNIEGGTGTILPERERLFSAVWANSPKMIKGKYKAEVRFYIPGGKSVLKKINQFTI